MPVGNEALQDRLLNLTIRQYCMHRPGVKSVWVQACLCRAAKSFCIGGYPLVECCNKGPTCTNPPRRRQRSPNDQRLRNNTNQNTVEATEAALILHQATPQFVFQPDDLELSPSVLTARMGGPLYWLAPSPPTRTMRSPRTPPLTTSHQRP